MIILKRIQVCGQMIKSSQDEFSVSYWNNELKINNMRKATIEKRYSPCNVIYVDFKLKKRKAA